MDVEVRHDGLPNGQRIEGPLRKAFVYPPLSLKGDGRLRLQVRPEKRLMASLLLEFPRLVAQAEVSLQWVL